MYYLIIILTFVLVLLLVLASLPEKRATLATKCVKSILSVFPITKICEALIAYFNRNKPQ